MFKLIWLIRDRAYWRSRAESLETKLESEIRRNRHFEREMISRIVTMTGQMGIQQEAPKVVSRPPLTAEPPPLSQTTLGNLTPQQIEDWQMYQEDGAVVGKTEGEAWNDFYNREVLSKMTITDDTLIDVEN